MFGASPVTLKHKRINFKFLGVTKFEFVFIHWESNFLILCFSIAGLAPKIRKLDFPAALNLLILFFARGQTKYEWFRVSWRLLASIGKSWPHGNLDISFDLSQITKSASSKMPGNQTFWFLQFASLHLNTKSESSNKCGYHIQFPDTSLFFNACSLRGHSKVGPYANGPALQAASVHHSALSPPPVASMTLCPSG